MISLLLAFQFLTRIPVHVKQQPTEKQIAQSVLYYPLVGIVIGVILFSFNGVLSEVDQLLRAASVLFIWVLITGALHLDGLADSADALVGGYGDKERSLAIMKDPYCGPMGVVSLVLILLLKFSAIASLSEESSWLLLLAPCLSRTSVLWSFITTSYVRNNGLGSSMARYFSRRQGSILLFVVSCLTLVSSTWIGLIILLMVFVTIFIIKQIVTIRFGGMTGDTLGAQIEIIESVILITGLLFISLL